MIRLKDLLFEQTKKVVKTTPTPKVVTPLQPQKKMEDHHITRGLEIANKFTKYSNMIAKFLKESSCFEDSDSADLRKYESDLFHHFCKDKSECSDIKAVRPKKDFFSDEKNAQSLKRELTLAVKTHVILES